MNVYFNTKTRQKFATSNIVTGGNWVLLEDYEEPVETEVKETEEVEEEPEEKTAYDSITKADIKNELDALGVEYKENDNKDVLWSLLQKICR